MTKIFGDGSLEVISHTHEKIVNRLKFFLNIKFKHQGEDEEDWAFYEEPADEEVKLLHY